MSPAPDTAVDFGKWFRVLRTYRMRWMIPTAALTAMAIAYAVLHRPNWQAAQALVVRSEASAGTESPGKFRQAEDMKVSQETVLEIARGRSVLAAALADVGPVPGKTATDEFPTAKNIAGLRKAVSMTAPKGAEFGTTEIFYLNVKDRDRQRAVDLATAISRHLQTQFQDLLDSKAKSMTAELQRAVGLAESELQQSTAQLGKLEADVGTDLAELRSISKLSSGGSGLQQALTALDEQLRAAKVSERSSSEMLAMLRGAQRDSLQVLAMPNSLLEKLPALRRLKEGLVDAQLRTAQLLGAMSEAHPSVQNAIANEHEVEKHIRRELPLAIRSIEVDRRLARIKVDSIEQQATDVRQRSEGLAAVRSEHAKLVAQVERHTLQIKQAESRLAETRSAEAGARAANLISLIDLPDTGTRPLGPGKTVITGVGFVGGLMVGIGILFLTVPTNIPTETSPIEKLPQAFREPALAEKAAASSPMPRCASSASPGPAPCRGKLTLTQALAHVAHRS